MGRPDGEQAGETVSGTSSDRLFRGRRSPRTDTAPAARTDPAERSTSDQAVSANAQLELLPLQYRKLRLHLIALRLSIALRLILLLAILLLLLFLALVLAEARASSRLLVQPFTVPEALEVAGATGEVVASAIADEMVRLRGASDPAPERWHVVEVDRASPPFRDAYRLVRRALGGGESIEGNIVNLERNSLRMTVRGDEIAAGNFSGRLRDLPVLTIRAAEHVYGSVEPGAMLRHLDRMWRHEAATVLAPRAYAAARTDTERSEVARLWSTSLALLGRHDDALERARAAVSLDRSNRAAKAVFITAAADEEASLVASRRPGAVASPGDPAFFIAHRVRENWAALALTRPGPGVEEDAKGPARSLLALAEAFRHDHRAAEAHLAAAGPADPLALPIRELVAGLRSLDLGRADLAVRPLRRFGARFRSSAALQHLFPGYDCYLALGYANVGREKDALRVLEGASGGSRCRAFGADVLALGGEWRQARIVYRRALLETPSMPVPWQRAGAALLDRGDAAAAALLFRGAIQRAPGWADPRRGLADALVQLGRVDEAEVQYRAAARLAPRWGAAAIAWGQALWRLGRREEALARFRAAAGMDLSAADRIRLQSLQLPG